MIDTNAMNATRVDIELLKPEKTQTGTAVEMTVDTVDCEQTAGAARGAKPTSDAPTDDTAKEATSCLEAVFTPVYNGVTIPIKASDTERVTTLLQKGMKFEHMAQDLERLHQLKEAYQASTVHEVICRIAEEKDRAMREEYIEKYGEEAGGKLFELEKAQQQTSHGSFCQADAAEDVASEQRMANEFATLKDNHPHVTSMEDIPQAVKELAAKQGIALLDAYNRHILNEQRHAANTARRQVANQQTAIGSLADSGAETLDPVWEAFMRGTL